MKRLLWRGFVLLDLLSIVAPSATADDVVAINTGSDFTCSSGNCTFADNGELLLAASDWDATTGTVMPGTMAINASGDLGSLG